MPTTTIPSSVDDPVNARILAVSEDRVQGFTRYPFHQIADGSGVEVATVVERIRAMLQAGTVRRVRQTLLATSLAPGALVAWKVPPDRIKDAFDFMVVEDPFSGHVVTRTTDRATRAASTEPRWAHRRAWDVSPAGVSAGALAR